jgi:hypothetical protein
MEQGNSAAAAALDQLRQHSERRAGQFFALTTAMIFAFIALMRAI